MTVRYRADNIVTGLTANILAAGLTSYLLRVLSCGGRPIAIHPTPLAPLAIPGLSDLPVVGPLLFALPPLTYLAIAGSIALSLFFSRTQLGLILRATGEIPDAVFASGVEPMRVRILAVVGCGAIAGLGGAVLPLQQVGTFTDGMTGGRGYLALASPIVARWDPLAAMVACLIFGAAEAFELRLQGFGVPASSYVVQMASYLIALVVLAGLGRSRGCRRQSDNPTVGSMMADAAETLEELAVELADGRMTSITLVERSLDRVARLDRRLNSFVAIEEAATASAEESDARRKRGETKSRLDGIPLSVKDSIHVVGLPSTWGSRTLAGFRPPRTNCRSHGCAAPASSSSARRTCRNSRRGLHAQRAFRRDPQPLERRSHARRLDGRGRRERGGGPCSGRDRD